MNQNHSPSSGKKSSSEAFSKRKTVRLDKKHTEILSRVVETGEYENESDAIRTAIEQLEK